ncbi:restriction endonuclease subunit S [Sulfuricurvum sp.]|uniref:restriction endonuclease subunit S n=1 Tax=Sulfuricurvum sp. TaxID=2025608 RepID=UPI002623DE1D|nr:restriction endonuclease subunit S [Sulfuricurvum sp.]MDD3594876.1 restriction endonuclease subunit S [Sulfuricurvum sp.]
MIDLPANALETLNRLFAKYVPHCEVRAFGSRVKWTSKDYSDLDLAIVCDEPIERKLFNRLKEEIEEIPINFRVDLLDWHKISPEFQKIIEEQYEIIYAETSQNSDEWKYYRVDEFAEIVGGGTPKTDIDAYWNGSIPWLTPKDLSGYTNRFISHGERHISAEGLKNSSAKLVPAGAVLLTSRAPVGYVAIAQNEVCTNQGFRSLIPKDGFDSEFIYYVLFHNTEYLKSHATGTTFQELSGGALKNLSFQIPSLKTQKKIVKILSSLDDKIALNREINKTLEAMAQAIFKSWFVDFEPFKEGKFVESELGMIPQGWEVKPLTEDFVITMGQSPDGKTYNENGEGIPFFQGRTDFGFRFPSNRIYCTDPKRYAKKFDTLVSVRAPVGDMNLAIEDCCIGRGLSAVRHKKGYYSFTYYLLKSIDEKFKQFEHNGTVFGSINKASFENLKAIIPNDVLICDFEKIVNAIDDQVYSLSNEIQTLSILRDTLLPKLLSGEIAV